MYKIGSFTVMFYKEDNCFDFLFGFSAQQAPSDNAYISKMKSFVPVFQKGCKIIYDRVAFL